jgi:glycosyltransferase involved in cell wall biosynthesis
MADSPEHSGPVFTVFTPTRDRASTLHRPYESLKAQTFRDFEWLIVDNESSDGTPALVEGWQQEGVLPIRYVYQTNEGLHRSWNTAVREARGRFLVTLASDDSCFPVALERLAALWETIPPDERDAFTGVSTIVTDQDGKLVGDRFPQDVLDSTSLELRYRYHVRGEKWGFQRVDVMRRFPFPTIDGYTSYVPEGIVWDAIGREYKERYVNEVLRQFWLDAPVSLARPRRPSENAPGALFHATELLTKDIGWARHDLRSFFLIASRYVRFSFHAGRSAATQWRGLRHPVARALWVAALPLGYVRFLMDQNHRLGRLRYMRSA